MKDVLARLRKINPDVLVEFRQHYMGPAIRQYGNMIRAADCPADPTAGLTEIAVPASGHVRIEFQKGSAK